jgi:hypothetical protein
MLKPLCIFLFVFTTTTHAETCPTIMDIHLTHFSGWQAYDIDNGTPVSGIRLKQYAQSVQQFALAEWMEDAPEGSGHCYYFGNHHESNYLSVYLAKPHLTAEPHSIEWTSVGKDVKQCHSGIIECRFMEK